MKYQETRVVECSAATGAELEVMLHIAHLAGDDGTYSGGDDRLYSVSPYKTRESFTRAVDHLVETGELERTKSGYRLALPQLDYRLSLTTTGERVIHPRSS